MKKASKWETYWRKRAVKAEAVLTQLHSIAGVHDDERTENIIDAYFKSVAAGEVKDTALPAAEGEASEDK